MVRYALVTGGAGGLGRALAAHFLERGIHVVLADRDEEMLVLVRSRLGDPDGLECQVLDVSDGLAWAKLARRWQSNGRTLDILVNNACIASAREPLLEIAPEHWRSMLDVALTGAFLGIHAFVPAMVARGHGYVLNIASMAALGPSPRHGDYAAAKAGLVSLSETLRDELKGTGVQVSVACPGAIGHAVGHAWKEGEACAAVGRMDPFDGMRHVIDSALAGQFFIMTHGDLGESVATRAQAIAEAFRHASGWQ